MNNIIVRCECGLILKCIRIDIEDENFVLIIENCELCCEKYYDKGCRDTKDEYEF